MKYQTLLAVALCGFIFTGCGSDNNDTKTSDTQKCDPTTSDSNKSTLSQIRLGERLYHDTSLSKNKTMACATCHVIDNSFVDPRPTSKDLGASLGDDFVSIGDRNAPTAGYAMFTPKFHFDEKEGLYIGGQFLDGRATDLTAQAKGPFLNPGEMKMPDAASVVARVKENEAYVQAFKKIYGDGIFNDTQKAYEAVAETIAKFEKSDTFAPFSSKYDKSLKGEITLTAQEKRGLALFNEKAKCNACHPSEGEKAHFTDFTYDNLGVPVNHALRVANGKGEDFVDNGLFENPDVNDTRLKGAFRVATLRNIAVTGPYMHNGVFKKLETVVHFYNTRDVHGAINPETGEKWEKGEVDINKNTDELGNLGLTEEEEADLVAFLKTLTDEQYEHLIP